MSLLRMPTLSATSCVLLVLHLVLIIAGTPSGGPNPTTTMDGTGSVTPTASRSTYPNPWQDQEQCGSTGSSWICDIDSVLTKETLNVVNVLLNGINSNASCVCNCSRNETAPSSEGYVLAVVVVRTLPEVNVSSTNQTYKLKQLGDAVRYDWFDDRVCDDSALIAVRKNDSEIYISLGVVLTALLPENTLPSIYAKVRPSLLVGNLSYALPTTITELDSAIETALPNATAGEEPNNLVWGILGLIAVSSILLFHYWIKY